MVAVHAGRSRPTPEGWVRLITRQNLCLLRLLLLAARPQDGVAGPARRVEAPGVGRGGVVPAVGAGEEVAIVHELEAVAARLAGGEVATETHPVGGGAVPGLGEA